MGRSTRALILARCSTRVCEKQIDCSSLGRGQESEHDMFNIIETARLLLRPWQANDLADLDQLWAFPAARQGRQLRPDRLRPTPHTTLHQSHPNAFSPAPAHH